MNQKKNRGFTLIELLAVIVILAIIALIAVPVIMNIISKANKSAFKDTAYGIINAGELYFAERQLEPNGMLEDVMFEFPNNIGDLQIKGELPNGIMVVNTKGEVTISLKNDRYCITKDYKEKDVTITDDIENCEMPKVTYKNGILSSENVCIKSGACNPGTSVSVKVNNNDTYDFDVLSDTGDEITLIMDKIVGETVAWVSKLDYNDDTTWGYEGRNNKGPITALNYLNAQTANWTNIPAIESYTYNNNLNGNTKEHGYQKLEITNGVGKLTSQDDTIITTLTGTMRARLITLEEMDKLTEANQNKIPSWLYMDSNGDLYYGSQWFLTNLGSSTETAHSQVRERITSNTVHYDLGNVVRPIITIKLENREKVLMNEIILDKEEVNITIGTKVILKTRFFPENANNKVFNWTSSNTDVATVSNGTITGVGLGTATITVTTTDGTNLSKTINVKVEQGLTIAVGESYQLTTNVLPNNAVNKELVWSSSNPFMLSVDANGLVTGNVAGTAIITVTSSDGSGHSEEIQVTVQ